jgi:hypothetical protein
MSTATLNRRPQPRGRFAKIYAGVWVLLAALALSYMVTLAVQPSLLGAWVPTRSEPDTNEGQRSSAARFATDLTGLRQSVGEIQRDLSSLRTTVTAGLARGQELAERLAVVEERTKPVAVVAEAATPVAAPKTAAQRQAEARAHKAEVAAAAQTQAAAAPIPAADAAAPAPQVTMLNVPAPAASPIATGSIQAPPAQGVLAPRPSLQAAAQPAIASFGPGAVKAAAPAGPVGVELSSGPSLDALRLNWSLLADRHAASLKNLEARYTNAGEGQPYQLVAGPIGTPEEAARVCAQLKAKRVACRVTGFGGNAL